MTSDNIKKLVKEEISKQLLQEIMVNLDHLHDGISTSTITGQVWFKLISSLESIINEVKDFKTQYSDSYHGPLPNTEGALIQLQMIAKALVAVKPVILGMDDIEKHDI